MPDIFIVEDDKDLVETYTDLLEAYEYSVESTAKAIDALTKIMRAKPNIILLDLNLAGYSGTIVINTTRRHPELKDTKIIVITGHPEMLKRYDSDRVDLVLIKPVSNDQLLQTVRRFSSPPIQ
jgi:CheY-like chemotaxis protein